MILPCVWWLVQDPVIHPWRTLWRRGTCWTTTMERGECWVRLILCHARHCRTPMDTNRTLEANYNWHCVCVATWWTCGKILQWTWSSFNSLMFIPLMWQFEVGSHRYSALYPNLWYSEQRYNVYIYIYVYIYVYIYEYIYIYIYAQGTLQLIVGAALYNTRWFLRVRVSSSFDDLKAGLEYLKRKSGQQTEGPMTFVKANLSTFMDCYDTLSGETLSIGACSQVRHCPSGHALRWDSIRQDWRTRCTNGEHHLLC